jgi:hypothetical protein
MNIDTALAELDAHEAAIRTKHVKNPTEATPDATADDTGSNLHALINNVFSTVEQQQRLDAGRNASSSRAMPPSRTGGRSAATTRPLGTAG